MNLCQNGTGWKGVLTLCLNRKAVKSIIILLLLLLPLCLSPLHCEAAEITAEQLTALEVRLNRLDEINKLSLKELQTLKKELAASQQALTEARKQSAELTAQLAALKATSKKQEALLQTAEKSSAVLEKTQAKKTLNEYAVQVDDFNSITGAAYGRYFRLGDSSRYIGARAAYNWDDSQFSLWLAVLV